MTGAGRTASGEAAGPVPAGVPLLSDELLAGIGVEAGEFLAVDAAQPASPMPRLAPVTTAVLPVRLRFMRLLRYV